MTRDPAGLLGCAIEVLWPTDSRYYPCRVFDYSSRTRRYKVIYDEDDCVEHVDVADREYKRRPLESCNDLVGRRITLANDPELGPTFRSKAATLHCYVVRRIVKAPEPVALRRVTRREARYAVAPTAPQNDRFDLLLLATERIARAVDLSDRDFKIVSSDGVVRHPTNEHVSVESGDSDGDEVGDASDLPAAKTANDEADVAYTDTDQIDGIAAASGSINSDFPRKTPVRRAPQRDPPAHASEISAVTSRSPEGAPPSSQGTESGDDAAQEEAQSVRRVGRPRKAKSAQTPRFIAIPSASGAAARVAFVDKAQRNGHTLFWMHATERCASLPVGAEALTARAATALLRAANVKIADDARPAKRARTDSVVGRWLTVGKSAALVVGQRGQEHLVYFAKDERIAQVDLDSLEWQHGGHATARYDTGGLVGKRVVVLDKSAHAEGGENLFEAFVVARVGAARYRLLYTYSAMMLVEDLRNSDRYWDLVPSDTNVFNGRKIVSWSRSRRPC